MAVIELENIVFRRGERAILDGICWRVREGENWALLGANGSGKTTLLKVITGYEWPTEGSVTVLGERFGQCNLPRLRKRIGWVSSALEHRIPERDTAHEVVASGLDASLGLYREFTPDEHARVAQALTHVRADGYAGQRYQTLSQGEQQRVLIARALVSRPGLLILDEPCAGLDPAAREDFLSDLGRLVTAARAPATILVTHHIEEIGPWISRVLLLKAGRVLAEGPASVVLTSSHLSAAFGRPGSVQEYGGRYYFRLDRSG